MSFFGDVGSWLGHVNPTVLVPAIGAGAAYLYHTIRGDKKAAAEDKKKLINNVIDNIGHELLDKYGNDQAVDVFLKQSRDYLNKNLWGALEKRGVPRNATTEQWVHEGIEQSTAAMAKQVLAIKKKLVPALVA